MASENQEPLKPLIRDLGVTIQISSLVSPLNPREKCMFLSNIDQMFIFDVKTLHFFSANKDFPPDIVAEIIKGGLTKLLVPYEFLAGRLKMNHETSRFEIDCNGAGVTFVKAISELTLDEIGDLDYPNPAFHQLIVNSLDILQPDDQPLCMIQVTSFKCGGFSMGVSTSHTCFDGLSFKAFLQNLAALVADKPLAIVPCNNRLLLAARSPPRITFPHPELLKLDTIPTVIGGEEFDFKIFRLTSEHIKKLKQEAKSDTDSTSEETYITAFNVITAHVWRCKALSSPNKTDQNNSNYKNRKSTILYAVNIRSKLTPPLPESYAGNAIVLASATSTINEIETTKFANLVKLVSEGSSRIDDEYARSVIDWIEMYKGFPHGEVFVTSWRRLGFEQGEYPWGKPRYSCPVVQQGREIVVFLNPIGYSPHVDDVNVFVMLPRVHLEEFSILFHQFLK